MKISIYCSPAVVFFYLINLSALLESRKRFSSDNVALASLLVFHLLATPPVPGCLIISTPDDVPSDNSNRDLGASVDGRVIKIHISYRAVVLNVRSWTLNDNVQSSIRTTSSTVHSPPFSFRFSSCWPRSRWLFTSFVVRLASCPPAAAAGWEAVTEAAEWYGVIRPTNNAGLLPEVHVWRHRRPITSGSRPEQVLTREFRDEFDYTASHL